MKRYLLILFVALVAVGCEKSFDEFVPEQPTDCFYASIDAQETKAYWDWEDDSIDALKLYWSKNDTITIFETKTHNQQYTFAGTSGSRTGAFAKVEDNDFHMFEELSTNYAVYPFNRSTSFDIETGLISTVLPALQNEGASNLMVAVTKNAGDRELFFKNACGYLFLQFHGSRVNSVTIRGNNSEVISGPCTILASSDNVPRIQMTGSASNPSNRAICTNPYSAAIIDNEYHQTVGFALPPMTFNNGFTITLTDSNGRVIKKSVTGRKTITRNVVNLMEPIEVTFTGPKGYAVFEDANLRSWILSQYDLNGDYQIDASEAAAVTDMTIAYNGTITSLAGLDFFPNLKSLKFSSSSIIETATLNLKLLFKLEELTISAKSQINSIDCSGLTNLSKLSFQAASSPASTLSSINLTGCTGLTKLTLTRHPDLTNISLGDNTALESLQCSNSGLSTLDVSANTALKDLRCYGNSLSTLNLSANATLEKLYCYNNQLTSINLSGDTALEYIDCSKNQFTSLDVSSNTALKYLQCYTNQITTLNLSNNIKLTDIDCADNDLTAISLSSNTLLESLKCSQNQITSLDFSNNPAITTIYCYDNQLTSINIDNCSNLLDIRCWNNNLSSLDVSHNTALQILECGVNQLTAMDVSNNPDLHTITINGNRLTTINFSHTHLRKLEFGDSYVQTVDLSNLPALEEAFIYGLSNNVSSINFNSNTLLKRIGCYNNNLTSVSLSACANLETLDCHNCGSGFTELDVSTNSVLSSINCTSNPNLATVWIADGQIISSKTYDSGVTTFRIKTN